MEYLLVLLAAVIGSASMVGAGMWLHFRVRRLESERKHLRQLTEQLALQRDQFGAVKEQLAELDERLDFAERLLTQAREQKHELPGG